MQTSSEALLPSCSRSGLCYKVGGDRAHQTHDERGFVAARISAFDDMPGLIRGIAPDLRKCAVDWLRHEIRTALQNFPECVLGGASEVTREAFHTAHRVIDSTGAIWLRPRGKRIDRFFQVRGCGLAPGFCETGNSGLHLAMRQALLTREVRETGRSSLDDQVAPGAGTRDCFRDRFPASGWV